MIYSAIRTYRVEQAVYVEANSHAEAREKIRSYDWLDETDPYSITPDRWGRTQRRPDLAVDWEGKVVEADRVA